MIMAGYSGTPLVKKLGIKPGSRVYLFKPPADYMDWIHPLPKRIDVKTRLSAQLDFIHLFVEDKKTLMKEFSRAHKSLQKEGVMWVSWPKKSSNMVADLDGNFVREYGLKEGLVDIKVCAVDETWSGLKFVYRMKDRK
jgi:hypothetical protein